tara:strand:+ start:3236 stop:3946 length:711 start_codon:yes stop_codon:yes gene_type:complete
MIDELYIEAQGQLNKAQLGYFRPMLYNSFLRSSQIKITNKLLNDVRSTTRKMNWALEGKDFANFSEKTRQLLEYFSYEKDLIEANSLPPVPIDTFTLPSDLSFVEDVFIGTTRLDKVHYKDFLDLRTNIYANPTACDPICSKVGVKIKVAPATLETIQLHYLRLPKTPKWTYTEFQGKAMFEPTAGDFQEIDLPEQFYDELLSLVVEKASISLRELNVAQLTNQEQAQDIQIENRQ